MSDARQIKALLQGRIEAVVRHLFPNGKREGHHWCVGDITGAAGRSFKICLSGDKAGVWGDFDGSENHSRNLLNLWMRARNVDFKTALCEAAEFCGYSLHSAPSRSKPAGPASLGPSEWRACVEGVSEKHLKRLSDWRGYSGEFCSWLRQNDLVGLYDGCIAFPVHDAAGKVAAIHYRLRDGSWRYYPPGAKVRPLVIGELIAGDPVHVFESQWDAFAFMDVSGERSGIVITRGAGNGAFVSAMLSEGSTAYLWTQNDRAGEKWQTDICANTKATAKRARIPSPHGDLNDWTRAGATPEDLINTMASAETIALTTDQSSSDVTILLDEGDDDETEAEGDDDLPPFPVECLPPILERQARAVSELIGVPLAMSAPMVLLTGSAAFGKGMRVRGPRHTTPGNLYGMVCKTSGSGGTEAYKLTTRPLEQLQRRLRDEFNEKQKPWIEAELLDVSGQIEKCSRDLKNKSCEDNERRNEIREQLAELVRRRDDLKARTHKVFLVNEATEQALEKLLERHDETVANFNSDAGGALGIIAGTRFGKGEVQDTIWLKGYSWDQHDSHRISRDPVYLNAPCMSVLFIATPDKVQELFKNQRLTSGGLLARFLVCDPKARPVPMDASEEKPHKLPSDISQSYESAIWKVANLYRFKDDDEPFEIGMTTAARKLVEDDWNRFCVGCNGSEDHPFESRHTENAIRIGLVLHVFRCIRQKQESAGTFHSEVYAHEQQLDERTMQNALRIRDWFNLHQARLRQPEKTAAEDDAWHKAKAILGDRSSVIGITARDLYKNRGLFTSVEDTNRFLSKWVSEGRIERFQRKPEGSGRPTAAYRLAPLGRR